MEVCSACGGGDLFVVSKVSIAHCRPVMSVLCSTVKTNGTFEQEKEIIS